MSLTSDIVEPKPTPGVKALGVVLFAALIALGALVDVPMVPVPMSLQSLGVVLAGAALGPLWGVVAIMVYLAAAALGLPVLSGGASGIDSLTGATAGYLFGFLLAAWAAGKAANQGWLARPVRGIAILSLTHLLILVPGTVWLAGEIGISAAAAGGFTPFLPGAVAKSAVAWLLLMAIQRWMPSLSVTR